ncbi:MAG: hypothetical protein HY718_10685 [Planctomycetes bacterium]|nr:hypothetical protein [Planctomycetota bacterium]
MAYDLPLDEAIRNVGWKVKIRDRERLEPPHATILFKRRAWRLCLRTRQFLDEGDSWKQIPSAVREAIEARWKTLCEQWDAHYPNNPVLSASDEQDN